MRLFSRRAIIILFCFFQFLCANAFADNAWQPFNTGVINTGRVTALAINPATDTEIFAGTALGGLFKSTDGGKSWNELANNIFEGQYIRQIVYHPTNFNDIYVLILDKGIFQTEDSGQTWKQLSTIELPFFLTFNPINANEMFLTNGFKSLSKSTDGGKTWSDIKVSNHIDFCFRLLINPQNPKNLLLTAGNIANGMVYQSIDGGQNWQLLHSFDAAFETLFAPNNPNVLYVGGNQFYKSENAGQTWQSIFSPQSKDNYLSNSLINPKNPQEMYVVVYREGIYKTADGGKTWDFISNITAQNTDDKIQTIFNPLNPQELYVGVNNDGVFHSQDSGKTWSQLSHGLMSLYVTTLVFDPSNPNNAYAGTDENGLWMMHDGKTWEQGDAQFKPYKILKIAIDPQHSANILLLEEEQTSIFTHLFRSQDYGKTWVEVKMPPPQDRSKKGLEQPAVYALAFNPLQSNEVYAGGYDGQVWKSVDGGASWSIWNVIDNQALIHYVTDLIFNPKNPQEIYAPTKAFSGSIAYKSIDGGKTWMKLPYSFADNESTLAMTIDPTHPNVIYLATEIGYGPNNPIRFYKSEDSGMHLKLIGKGLPSVGSISSITVDPNNSQTIYAAAGDYEYPDFAFGFGVYVSYDGGEHFMPFNAALTNPIVTALAFSQGKLYAGTAGSGFWVRE